MILSLGVTAEEQARLALAVGPTATVMAVASWADVVDRAECADGEVLLVASDADEERARAAVTRDGLPRWPVLRASAAAVGVRLNEVMAHHAARREAARAHGDLLTMARRISHEMRSPLGCILTSADVMREELAESPTPAVGLLEPIVESANELLALIDRVSLVARASAMPPPMVDVDVGNAVWAAREYLAMKLHRSGAEVTEPAEWPTVRGVREWIERIWLNLIANAIQHAGPKPRIELRWRREDGGLRFCVRDQGPGVSPEIKEALFRPFHRLHEKDSGRGLGLAIVQRLVELQGGFCGYQAVDSGGSCFYFSLPDPSAR